MSVWHARVNAKQIVYGVSLDGISTAYIEDYLAQNKKVGQFFGRTRVRMVSRGNGLVSALQVQSGDPVVFTQAYWFVWYNVHPNTRLFGGKTVTKPRPSKK